MKAVKRKKIGLALGSGSLRGYAHLGVIKVLEENNIPIDYISGTSAGAIVGSLYSAYGLEKTEEILTNFKELRRLIDFSFKGGIFKGKKFVNYLNEKLENSSFEDLTIPFCAVATDYQTCKEVRIKTGDVALAVRASMSIPFLLEMVNLEGKELCDGGLSAPVPIQACREMGADIVIGVRIEDNPGKNPKKNGYSTTMRSIDILQHNLCNYQIEKSDIIITPYFEKFGLIGFDKIFKGEVPSIIEKGERAAEEELETIMKVLKLHVKGKGIYKL